MGCFMTNFDAVLQTNNEEILKDCISDYFLLLSRIAVPISMAIEVYLLETFFTIDGQHSRLVVRILRSICVFLFVCVACGVYYDSCFHYRISELFIITTVISSWALWMHIVDCTLRRCSSRNKTMVLSILNRSKSTTDPFYGEKYSDMM